MHLRDAMMKLMSKREYAVQSRSGVSIYWDSKQGMYNVYEEDKEFPNTFFYDGEDGSGLDDAVDYFLKITEDDRIARTEEEIENGIPGPLDG
jgi:hypothetical protein